jgi:hypothetical protein
LVAGRRFAGVCGIHQQGKLWVIQRSGTVLLVQDSNFGLSSEEISKIQEDTAPGALAWHLGLSIVDIVERVVVERVITTFQVLRLGLSAWFVPPSLDILPSVGECLLSSILPHLVQPWNDDERKQKANQKNGNGYRDWKPWLAGVSELVPANAG